MAWYAKGVCGIEFADAKWETVARRIESHNKQLPAGGSPCFRLNGPHPLYAHPSRGVVDEAKRDPSHSWPAVDRVLLDAYAAGTDGMEFDLIAARKKLQAAALPAVPDDELHRWHITEAWVHGGTVAELKLQRRFRGEGDAEVTDLCGQHVSLAAAPAQEAPCPARS